MPKTLTPFQTEASNAARGCWEILRGNREAARYFDLTTRGLAGSLAMVLALVALSAFAPSLTGASAPGAAHIAPTLIVLLNVIGYALQAAAAFLFLRANKRSDALIPYLVTSNWVLLAMYLCLFVATFTGPLAGLLLPLIGIAGLIAAVNIMRLIATLNFVQIVLFFVSQLVLVFIGVVLLLAMFPGLEGALGVQ